MANNLLKSTANINFSAIYAGLSSLSLSVIIVIFGNISVFFNLNHEADLIYYSATIYLVSNWFGLHDMILLKCPIKKVFFKLIFDYAILLAVVLCFLSIPSFNEHYDTVFLAIFAYPTFVCVYLLKADELYGSALVAILLFHLTSLALLFFDLAQITFLLIFGIYFFFLTILVSRVYVQRSSRQHDATAALSFRDWIVFGKIFFVTILFGEVDRYILAYFIDAKTAILYTTLVTLCGLIPLFSASLMQYLINQRNKGKIYRFDKRLKALFFSTVIVGIVTTYSLGYAVFSILLLSMALSFKYYFILKTLNYVVDFYRLDLKRKIYRLNLHQNLLGLVVNSMYLLFPGAIIITALSKLISSVPLILLDKAGFKSESNAS